MQDTVLKSQQNRPLVGSLVAKGASIAFLGIIIGQGLKFLTSILLARVLGAAGLGIYDQALSIVGLSIAIALLGINGGVVKFVAGYRASREFHLIRRVILTALTLPFLFGSLLALIVFILAPSIADFLDEPQLTKVLRVLAFGIPFSTLMMIAAFSARAFRAINYEIAIKDFFAPIATILLIAVAFFFGFGLLGAAYGTLVGFGLSAIVGLLVILKLQPDLFSGKLALFETRKLLYYSLPLAVIFITTRMSVELNRLILGFFGTSVEVGIYSVAARIGIQLSIFLKAIDTISAPLISAAHAQRDPLVVQTIFRLSARWALMFTLPAFVLVVLWRQPLLRIFGEEYILAGSVLVVLSFSRLIGAANGSNGIVLQMTGKQIMDMTNNIVMLVVSATVAILLVRRYGALGVALGAATGTIIVNLMKTIEIYLIMRIHPFSRAYVKPWLAGIIAVGSMLGLQEIVANEGWVSLMMVTIVFLFLYCFALLAFGIDEQEKSVLRVIKQRVLDRR